MGKAGMWLLSCPPWEGIIPEKDPRVVRREVKSDNCKHIRESQQSSLPVLLVKLR